jgi:hypothetical protein
MELISKLRWTALIIAVLTVIVGASVGVARIAKSTFSKSDSSSTVIQGQQQLAFKPSDYSRPETMVRFEVKGPIVADENFRSYRIDITREDKKFYNLLGYEDIATSSLAYNNNPAAYDSFLRTIERQGFGQLDKAWTIAEDRGYCVNGFRYYYEIFESGQKVFHSWGTSCSSKVGTSDATAEVKPLFHEQIPDFAQYIDKSFINQK